MRNRDSAVLWAILWGVGCAFGAEGVPSFRADDVRPHGSAEVRPLIPGLLTWIFGTELSGSSGCGAERLMDPATYRTELCGVRVLVGGREARLVAVMPGQINLLLPDVGWENEMVDFQVVREGRGSATVPVYFGFNRPVLSLAAPALAGLPVWLRVDLPCGKERLGYPFNTRPWEIGPGIVEVRGEGREIAMLSVLPFPPWGVGGSMSLSSPVPKAILDRVPLHLVYPLDRPGRYEVRYTEFRDRPGSAERTVYQQSDWTAMEVGASTAAQRRAWFKALTASRPNDVVTVLADFLPSLLAERSEASLRVLARYLAFRDRRIRQYAEYALNYFDPGLRRRVVPGREPLRGGVR